MKIKKGDTVRIVSGKDRGKTGKVTRAFPKDGAVVVEGVNVKKRHKKTRKSGGKGQILSIAAPVDASTVMLLDPSTGRPTRVGYKRGGEKVTRVAKRSGATV